MLRVRPRADLPVMRGLSPLAIGVAPIAISLGEEQSQAVRRVGTRNHSSGDATGRDDCGSYTRARRLRRRLSDVNRYISQPGGLEVRSPLFPLAFVVTLSTVAGPGQSFDLPQSSQDRGVESRYSSIWPHDCTSTGDGAAEGQDWVSYRCEGQGGIPVHLFFSDGVRLSLGFGERSDPFMGFRADRERTWPIEWRGRTMGGHFVPHAAIVRMKTHPEEDGVSTNSKLIVFGLSGTTCILGEVSGRRANEDARRLADNGRC
jgi:hypothetical protein